MAEPVTPNKGYTIPNTGDLINTWGPVLNNNFSEIDSNISGFTSLVLSSGTYTLNSTQAANLRLQLAGTLAGTCTIVVPQKKSLYVITDDTARQGYAITISTGAVGGTTQNLPSQSSLHFTDGNSVFMIAPTMNDVGEIKAFAIGNIPPLYIPCDGRAVSRTTYSWLFGAIGTTWGNGDGSTTFNVPDLRGRALFGADGGAERLTNDWGGPAPLGGVGGNQYVQAHDHTITIANPSTGGLGLQYTSAPTFGQTLTGTYGLGNSQNIPPAAIINWAIYAGA